jgi:hypothetical protein
MEFWPINFMAILAEDKASGFNVRLVDTVVSQFFGLA